ncbi:hypothetical protein NDU88_001409 [Pleurodeles waltl]|uniref:Uncharacterized protein n=1 Tax=Pleurodeles waltl TaxID=8319 RepID=A0AAV7SZI6_PLEWA|nr:hypothetical protein NDU88_001409 [Pleurodeles waltl]
MGSPCVPVKNEPQRLQRALSHLALCSLAWSLPYRKRSVSRGLERLKNEPQAQNPCCAIPIAIERRVQLESQRKSAADRQSSTEERPLVDLTRHCDANLRSG